MRPSAAEAVGRLVGASPAMLRLRAFIPKIAARDCTVLITGETGTGKERVAEAIHASSVRAHRNFVCINCAAIPESLVESELFGYEKGAFTGAHTRSPGRLQEAAGGTVFLDEIGDMSLVSQAKILRAVEQKQIYKVGGRAPESLDIRIIAATNQNLGQMVASKQFRSDLYYRLSVVNIELPPLRDRREDIALLFTHYMKELCVEFDWMSGCLTSDALNLLLQYDWPGNIRELRNLVEFLLLDPSRQEIGFQDLPSHMQLTAAGSALCERERLIATLVATQWNKSAAAKRLRCSRMTLYRKMTKFKLSQSCKTERTLPQPK